MSADRYLTKNLTPGHPHPEVSSTPEPPKFLRDSMAKYQDWLEKRKRDADGMCAMMKEDTLAVKSGLKAQFERQVDILRVLQMKLIRPKTSIGWNGGQSTAWMLLHFSGKYKEYPLHCGVVDNRMSTPVHGQSTLKEVPFQAKATVFVQVIHERGLSNFEIG